MSAGKRNPELNRVDGGARGLDPLSPAQGVIGPESAGQITEQIKQIMQQYLSEEAELKKQRDARLKEIPEDDPFQELEVHDEYLELENALWEKYHGKLKELLDEVDLEEISDGIVRVGRKIAGNKQYVYYYYISNASLDVYEMPLITLETTPFTYELMKRIDWARIRPTWAPNIHGFIITLAEAELCGNLEKVLKEVEEKLRSGAWIYDYQHMLNALEKTKQMLR